MSRLRTAVVFASLIAPTALAQAPPAQSELLDRTKQINAVAAQKVEADVRLILRETRRLETANQTEALKRLKEALVTLESNQLLPPERKATLTRVVRDRIRITEAGPDSPEEIAARQKAEEARKSIDKAEAERRTAEIKKVREGLETVGKLRKEGKTTEAEKLASELANKYPQSIAMQLLTGKQTFEKSIVESEKVKKETEQAFVASIRDIDKAGIPATGDIEFPKDWHERTKLRRDAAAPTPEERKLIQVLDRPVDVRYKETRFQDAMDHLSETLGRTIMVDNSALTEAGVNYDTPVSFSVRQPVSTRTTLRMILSNLNLTFVVRDNIIHVTTPGRAKDLMITKVYYLGDLITGLGPMGGAPTVGLNLDQIQLVQNVTAIVEMIRGAVDPMSWDGRGGAGQGSIGVNLQTMSLIVRQSQEVHAL